VTGGHLGGGYDDWDGGRTLPPSDLTDSISVEMFKRRASENMTLPTLKVIAGPDSLRFCSIYPDEQIIIGREDACALPLVDASVSRRHASVTSSGSKLALQDLGSTNGTHYKGKRISAPVLIDIGDEIQIGSVKLRVERLGLDELAHLARMVIKLDQSIRDPLTSLLSRQYLDDELPENLLRHHRAHVTMTAVFLDVDHFKILNDSFGHAMGDQVLVTVSRILKDAIRTSDTAIRYGGEEFVLVLANCDEEGGVALAERIRKRVQEHDWSMIHSAADDLVTTISLGVAEYRGESVAEWIDRADKAMYAAKRAGRNRTHRHRET